MSQHVVEKAVMPRARIHEFFRRFPSLRRYAEEPRVARISVQQIDLDLMQQTPGRGGDTAYGTRDFFLIDRDHAEMKRVSPKHEVFIPRKWFWPKSITIPAQRVDETIPLIDVNTLFYIIEVVDLYPVKEHGRIESSVNITIHRLPNGVTLKEWLARQQERIRREVDEAIERSSETNTVIVITGTNTKCAHREGGGIDEVGFGPTEHSAVGQLILEDPERFGITIVRKKD